LRVHSNAVLPATVTLQPFQAVARGDPKILHIPRRMDEFELSQASSLHRAIDAFDVLLVPDAFGVLTAERSDHEISI